MGFIDAAPWVSLMGNSIVDVSLAIVSQIIQYSYGIPKFVGTHSNGAYSSIFGAEGLTTLPWPGKNKFRDCQNMVFKCNLSCFLASFYWCVKLKFCCWCVSLRFCFYKGWIWFFLWTWFHSFTPPFWEIMHLTLYGCSRLSLLGFLLLGPTWDATSNVWWWCFKLFLCNGFLNKCYSPVVLLIPSSHS